MLEKKSVIEEKQDEPYEEIDQMHCDEWLVWKNEAGFHDGSAHMNHWYYQRSRYYYIEDNAADQPHW